MIAIKLDRLLAERGLRLSQLARRVGISLPNLSLLKTGKVKEIRLALLDALCRELDCQPGDLLLHVSGPPPARPEPPRPRAVNAGIDFVD